MDFPNPFENILTPLKHSLSSQGVAVLTAPPGLGKSTILPLLLAHEPWLDQKKVLILQPRRLATKSIATRLAENSGTALGGFVGYQIRFERLVSKETQIEVITEGILTRRMQSDPELSEVGLIIFDEFHERSLNSDLSLALALDIRQTIRPDLRLLVMSATLDLSGIKNFLPEAEIFNLEHSPHPLEICYLGEDLKNFIPQRAARETYSLIITSPGDALVFLPGVGEVKNAIAEFESLVGKDSNQILALPLYGELPYSEQAKAINKDPNGRRKVVFATPIAETSLTLDGVRIVVDTGLAKVAKFEPGYGMSRLVTERISADSCHQRAGRAARQDAGICLRLWTKHTQETMRKTRSPEIESADLTGFALELANWGSRIEDLRFVNQPPAKSLKNADSLLLLLGAIERSRKITSFGKELLNFGIHPRLASLLLRAKKIDQAELACDIAALLEERDPFPREMEFADISWRLEALAEFRRGKTLSADFRKADLSVLKRVLRNSSDLRRRLKLSPDSDHRAISSPDTSFSGLLLSFAFPERVAKKKSQLGSSVRYLMSNGLGVSISSNDPISKADLLSVIRIIPKSGDSPVLLAAEIQVAELSRHFSGQIERISKIIWDSATQGIRAIKGEFLGPIELSTAPWENAGKEQSSREQILEVYLDGIQSLGGADLLPLDEETTNLLARISFVKKHLNSRDGATTDIPLLDKSWLQTNWRNLVAPYCLGLTRAADFEKLKLEEIILSYLDYRVRQLVETNAPRYYKLPSGKAKRLDYAKGDSPILSATVQELFGLKETPKVCQNSVPLMLHILSPARRPVQVTQDLEGFWKNSYKEVRKELRGRYPKHKWPEDPTKE